MTNSSQRARGLASLAVVAVVSVALAAVDPVPTPTRRVLVGEIDGEITLTEAAYVKRLVETTAAEGYDVLALRLNTFGGRVDAAVAIRDTLLDVEVPTVVFIDRRAISAGALISLACKKIAMTKGGTIGAATPITSGPGQEVPQPVEEKVLSYFRQEMRATAEANGRDGDIAEAMVDADKSIEGVSEEGELLTLTTTRALELGFVDVESDSLAEALAALDLGGATTPLERSWAEQVAGFLTSAPIASLLLLGMLVFGYLEFQTPGFGVFGLSSIVCFLLLYFGHNLVALAGWEELLLFGIGALLLAIEILVLPGFGVVGALGALAVLIAAAMVASTGNWTDFDLDNPFTERALLHVSAAALGAVAVVLLLARFLPRDPRSPFGGALVLGEPLARTAGYSSHDESPLATLLGRTGVAITALRPAGKATIDGQRLDVETEGDWLERGTAVEVLRIAEGRVVVRRRAEESADA